MINKFTADKTNGESCHYKTLDLAPKGSFSCQRLANLSEVHLSKFSKVAIIASKTCKKVIIGEKFLLK